MPAFVNSSVGSLPGTSELDGTICVAVARGRIRGTQRRSSALLRLSGHASHWPRAPRPQGLSVGIVARAERSPDLLGGEPAILQEAGLLCTLAEVCAAVRHRTCAGAPAGRLRPSRRRLSSSAAVDGLGVDARLPQARARMRTGPWPRPRMADGRSWLTKRSSLQQLLGGELLDDRSRSCRPAGSPCASSSASQLAAREVRAPREQRERRACGPALRRPPACAFAVRPRSPHSFAVLVPSSARAAWRGARPRSRGRCPGAVCRKLRALSLPWPMRSPL